MVDSDIELLIGADTCARSKPVLVNASAGEVRLGKVAHHLLRDWINQIACSLVGRAGALISGEIIEGDESAAHDPSRIRIKDPRVWIPNLASGCAAQAGAVERSALGCTHLAKIAGAHGSTGNGSGGGPQARLTQA